MSINKLNCFATLITNVRRYNWFCFFYFKILLFVPYTIEANSRTYRTGRQFDLGEFLTSLYFEQFMADDTVNCSARQISGHGPNAESFTGKVIGAIKTSSTDNVVAFTNMRRLFIQAVSNFPWFDEVRVRRLRLCSYESCTACSLIWRSAGRQN